VQPHRFTRLRDLFEDFSRCFKDADVVAIADIYTAGENPIEGVTPEALVVGISKTGHPNARRLASLDDLPAFVRAEAKPGDIVVCLGAGDITAYANALPAKLATVAAA
jgi:UDP-N-acetylmuramate--alanine ligase